MRSLEKIRAKTPKSEIYRGQVQHIMLAILLSAGALSLLKGEGAFFWVKLAIGLAILHQVLVAIVFRLQLHLNLMVRYFGDKALNIWGMVFLPLLGVRPVLLIIVGLLDYGSLTGGGRFLQLVFGVALIVPAAWTMHSVLTYFSINRALGGDHFYDKYLNMPMVNQGAFKYFPNAMYSVVFSGFWGIALVLGSWNALVLALFYHSYIWVHMYCTEDPDMRILYADSPSAINDIIEAEIIPEPEPKDEKA